MLAGEKVLLRAVQRDDVPALWKLHWADLEVEIRRSMRPPIPRSLAQMEAEFEKDLETPPEDQALFAIEVGGEVIGDCGLFGINRFHGFAYLGIGLGREHWNKGYGQDAVRTLVGYGFRHLALRRISLEVLADDPRAVGAYRKVGFVEEGRLRQRDWVDGAYHDSLVMPILRDEWEG